MVDLSKHIERINSFLTIEAGWCNGEGTPVSRPAMSNAIAFLLSEREFFEKHPQVLDAIAIFPHLDSSGVVFEFGFEDSPWVLDVLFAGNQNEFKTASKKGLKYPVVVDFMNVEESDDSGRRSFPRMGPGVVVAFEEAVRVVLGETLCR